MTPNQASGVFAALQFSLFVAILTLLVRPVGTYLYHVFTGDRTLLTPLFRPFERFVYRLTGVNEKHEMTWIEYAVAFTLFSVVGIVILFLILITQTLIPSPNSAELTTPMTVDLALNTAISFATTSTWQAYGGETTMTYLTQMLGLAAQNFISGAAGLAIGIAFIRGFARQETTGLGNFWVDVTGALLYVLLPVAFVGALILVAQGTPMNIRPAVQVTTLEGATQQIAQGPVAALEIIKNLGTNGGGFFNTNGAHPYANPTPFTNFFSMLVIVAIPAGLTYTFGRMVKQQSQGWLVYFVMVFFFVVGLTIIQYSESERADIPITNTAGIETSADQPSGNMEGKETRFGIGSTSLAVTVVSNAATGSVSAMHASLTPLSAAVTLFNMLIGEVVFGGLGTGLFSMVLMVVLSVFIGGLMVGRTPEYLGKRIRSNEIKITLFYMLITPVTVLLLTGLAVVTQPGLTAVAGDYPTHGFTAILYAYTTSVANNGANFANISANTPFYNVTTGIAMLMGRFGLVLPALALAGQFVKQQARPYSSGTMPTVTIVFAALLIMIIIVVGALSFFPALALGPLVEQFIIR